MRWTPAVARVFADSAGEQHSVKLQCLVLEVCSPYSVGLIYHGERLANRGRWHLAPPRIENHSERRGVTGLRQVLLIDDNPLQLSVREAVLRKAGFQVSVAATAEGALATSRSLGDRLGVIVTDHLMPDCSGSGLVHKIRRENDWLPIIVLSGLAEAAAEYEGLDVTFRIKPIPPEELIELVRSGLAQAMRQRGAA